MVKLQTNFGTITLELDAEKAPQTVANFLQYVNDGFYNDTIFHRVIDGFMIQGGGFMPDMTQKATRDQIQNEATNGLKNDAYTIAMARTPNPHSASSQFFINIADNGFLNSHRANLARLGLLRIRQSGRRPGRGRQDQESPHRQQGRPSGCAG